MENTRLSMHEVLLKNFIEDIRPEDEEIRKEVDLGYSWDGQCAILFEIRPAWNDSGKVLELPFAKLQYVKSKSSWKLYWMRGSGKWEAYQPLPSDLNLEVLLEIIGKDEVGCFFG
jgi:hypothetical protein